MKMRSRGIAEIFAAAAACALAIGLTSPALAGERGLASHYGIGDGLNGRLTACGKPLNAYAMVAASPTYRCGKRLKVINLGNNRSVVVTVVDYGPAKWTGRVIDLSFGAARALGFVEKGTAKVLVVPFKD